MPGVAASTCATLGSGIDSAAQAGASGTTLSGTGAGIGVRSGCSAVVSSTGSAAGRCTTAGSTGSFHGRSTTSSAMAAGAATASTTGAGTTWGATGAGAGVTASATGRTAASTTGAAATTGATRCAPATEFTESTVAWLIPTGFSGCLGASAASAGRKASIRSRTISKPPRGSGASGKSRRPIRPIW
ncbi:hypothetical protein D3C80_1265190 [compost metagenome]